VCLNLTRSEFRLLRMFMLRPDYTHDHEAIWDVVNPGKPAFSHNAIEVLVARLRQKVGRHRIGTVRGLGYRFEQSSELGRDLVA
jgi:two-component system, OmpR family, response regulator